MSTKTLTRIWIGHPDGFCLSKFPHFFLSFPVAYFKFFVFILVLMYIKSDDIVSMILVCRGCSFLFHHHHSNQQEEKGRMAINSGGSGLAVVLSTVMLMAVVVVDAAPPSRSSGSSLSSPSSSSSSSKVTINDSPQCNGKRIDDCTGRLMVLGHAKSVFAQNMEQMNIRCQ